MAEAPGTGTIIHVTTSTMAEAPGTGIVIHVTTSAMAEASPDTDATATVKASRFVVTAGTVAATFAGHTLVANLADAKRC